MGNVKDIISGTVLLIMVYLVVVNYRGAVAIIGEAGSAYSKAVGTLQGRK